MENKNVEEKEEFIELHESVDVPHENSELLVVNEILKIEKIHQSDIMAIHKDMQKLIDDCNNIQIDLNDPDSYKKAVELKRLVKRTHVSIKTRKDELKRPFLDYNKRLDTFADSIYTPLKNGELVVKAKMEKYEKHLEKIKEQNRIKQEAESLKLQEIENKLVTLNSQLMKINSAKTIEEIQEIDNYLQGVNIADFEEKSADAGFVLTQLKTTLKMAKKIIELTPVEEEKNVEEEKFIEDAVEEINTKETLQEVESTKEEPIEEPIEQITPELSTEVELEDTIIGQPTQIEPIDNDIVSENREEQVLENNPKNYTKQVQSIVDALPKGRNVKVVDLKLEDVTDSKIEDIPNPNWKSTDSEPTNQVKETQEHKIEPILASYIHPKEEEEPKTNNNETNGSLNGFSESLFDSIDDKLESKETPDNETIEDENIDIFNENIGIGKITPLGDEQIDSHSVKQEFDEFDAETLKDSNADSEKQKEIKDTEFKSEPKPLKTHIDKSRFFSDLNEKGESDLIEQLSNGVYKSFVEILDIQLLKVLEKQFDDDLMLEFDRINAMSKQIAKNVGLRLQNEY